MEVLDHDDIRRLLSAFDRLRRPRGPWLVFALLVISTLVFGSWALVYATGGTQYVYLHSMYVPILLAAFMFGARGGLVTGLVGGVVLGPFMPLDVPEGVAQSTTAWMLRVGFFALVGTIAGSLSSLLSLRLTMVERLAQTLSVTYSRTLKTFAMGVEVRDEPTGAHCERVAHNACAVGRELGFEGREMEMLQWAGLLHDLGKIATPEHILLKPGKLTDEEYEEMKRHAAVGAEMIETISPDFSDIAVGVRSHHERWDGGGYPDGVSGESIPLVGRILAVVDVFEALTSRRPYRRPMPPEEALAYVGERAGPHFDPRVVPVFERLYREGEIYASEVPDEKVELDASLLLEEEGTPRTEEVGEKTG